MQYLQILAVPARNQDSGEPVQVDSLARAAYDSNVVTSCSTDTMPAGMQGNFYVVRSGSRLANSLRVG